MIRIRLPFAAILVLGLAACQQGSATGNEADKAEAPEIAATPDAPVAAATPEVLKISAVDDKTVVVNPKVAPSFDCAKARPASIDAEICASPELAQLDRDMDEEYMRAMAETPRAVWPDILAEQREFIRSRNQCMGGKEKRHHCIAFAYESRIQRLADWIDGSWRE